jgi:lysozyme
MISEVRMAELVGEIKESEGFRPKPYLCPKGKASIGFGTNVEAHPGFIPQRLGHIVDQVRAGTLLGQRLVSELNMGGMIWSPRQAEAALVAVLEDAAHSLEARFPWVKGLDSVRHAVLLDMAYNMGVGKLAGFKKTLGHVEAGRYEDAAAEMLNSDWARQVKGRALKLSNRMRLGQAV